MTSTIDFSNSLRNKISFINEIQAAEKIRLYDKKWSFSFIYYLTELRDIYLALSLAKFSGGSRNFKKNFTQFCLSIDLPFVKTAWNERRILEYLNALENFSLINSKYEIKNRVFTESQIGTTLTQSDIESLKEIYFSYFRFKEMFSWLLKPPINPDIDFIIKLDKYKIYQDSKVILFFRDKSRFADNFFYELVDDANIYYIDEKRGDLSRFWDVFTTWGKNLGILEKFSFRFPPIKPFTSGNKDTHISCCYLVNEVKPQIDILEYVNKHYESSYIYLPDLVIDIVLKFRLKVEDVHEIIIQEYKKYREILSFERTSEIFINKGKLQKDDKILFPKYNDAYISYLIVRR